MTGVKVAEPSLVHHPAKTPSHHVLNTLAWQYYSGGTNPSPSDPSQQNKIVVRVRIIPTLLPSNLPKNIKKNKGLEFLMPCKMINERHCSMAKITLAHNP
jgi:hypothetical protein